MEDKKEKSKIIDLIGHKFGRLTVVSRADNRIFKNGKIKVYWLCECDCGNTKEVNSQKLRNGETKSCGCLNRELVSKRKLKNLIGVKFGELTVIERAEDYISPKGKHVVMWKCVCSCGNHTLVTSTSLNKKNGTLSCGCLRIKISIEGSKKYAIDNNGSLEDWINKNLPKNFIELYWSKNNKTCPSKMPYAGNDIIHIICPDCLSEYSIKTYRFTTTMSRCPICNLSKGEQKIKRVLDYYNINYKSQMKFNNLIGINNGLLSYDFYLLNYNLLIEYQGNFHDGSNGKFTQFNLKNQQEHDRRKRQYAINNNIKLLEIWYYDFDKIEDILIKELKLKGCDEVGQADEI